MISWMYFFPICFFLITILGRRQKGFQSTVVPFFIFFILNSKLQHLAKEDHSSRLPMEVSVNIVKLAGWVYAFMQFLSPCQRLLMLSYLLMALYHRPVFHCGGSLVADSGFVGSEGFPDHYKPNSKCTWIITVSHPPISQNTTLLLHIYHLTPWLFLWLPGPGR